MADTLVGLPAVRIAPPHIVAHAPLAPAGALERPASGTAAPDTVARTVADAIVAPIDALFGHAGSYPRFRAIELVARVIYQAWESVAYVEITSAYPDRSHTAELTDRVASARRGQDRAHRHLVTMQELCARSGAVEHAVRHLLAPRLLAHAAFVLAWIAHALAPRWTYRVNAELADRIEREYLRFVEARPELAGEPSPLDARASVAEALREMAREERELSAESLARAAASGPS